MASIVVYRHRLADALNASHRAFHDTLLENRGRGRGRRLGEALGPWFLLVFGLSWIALSLLALLGPLVGIGEWEGL